MKKLYFLLLPAWFVICAVVGFLLFYVARQFMAPSPLFSQKAQVFNTQYNLLIIHVDSLQKEETNVRGVWMLFVTLSRPPNVILKELDTQSVVVQVSDSLDSLERGKEVHHKSVVQLIGLNVPLRGYVIFDDEGREQLLSTLTSVTSARKEMTDDSWKRGLINNNLCDVLLSSPSFFEVVAWSDLVPQHLQTDVEMSDLLVIYDLVYHSTPLPECKEIEK